MLSVLAGKPRRVGRKPKRVGGKPRIIGGKSRRVGRKPETLTVLTGTDSCTHEERANCAATSEERPQEKTGSISTASEAKEETTSREKEMQNRRNPGPRRGHPTVVEGLRGVCQDRHSKRRVRKPRPKTGGQRDEKLQAGAGEETGGGNPDTAEQR